MDTGLVTAAVTRDGRSCVLTIAGDLDVTTAAMLTPAVAAVTGHIGALNGQIDQVALDLAGLAVLDVGGARALIAAVQAVPGGHPVTVRSISPIASRLFGLLGWSLETSRHARSACPAD